MSATLPATNTGTSGASGRRRPNSTLIVIYLALGGLSFAVLQSLVAPALTTIGTDLKTTET
jgi:hypothetical protein